MRDKHKEYASMLDDLKYIHEKDQADALGIAGKPGKQLREKFTVEGEVKAGQVTKVVHAGMGGSGWPADFLRTWPGMPVPFEVVRDYVLPPYVDKDTLVMVDSYSGNTEEAISCLEDALIRKATVILIAQGGKLQQIAGERGLPFIKLMNVEQPRFAALSNYRAILTALDAAGVVHGDDIFPVLDKTADFLDKAVEPWLPTVPAKDNPAKQLAQELMGKSIVMYGGPHMYPSAYKWKINFNENAKQVAWAGQIPEFNHNEFIGWSEQPVDKPYAVIDLRSTFEHPRVQKRFEVTERLLSGKRPEPFVVQAEGENALEHMLWAAVYGDFVSLYLALLNGLNPAPVELVEKFKKALDE